MKYIYALLFLVGCGYYDQGPRGPSGRSCTVTKQDDTTTITCPDGTQQKVLNGEKGLQGVSGPTGTSGGTGPAGHDGAPGNDGMAGKDGLPGPQGSPGVDGAQGIPGTTGTTGAVGATGAPGVDGLPGTLITPIVPCPENTAGYPEVLLCIDGSLYAVYDSEPNGVHYAKLSPGTYVTTDNRSCYFTVTTSCSLL